MVQTRPHANPAAIGYGDDMSREEGQEVEKEGDRVESN
jgi:hypothetical protein